MAQGIIEAHRKVPGPTPWPLVGSLPRLIHGDLLRFLTDLYEEHGDMLQFNLGPKPVYLVSKPAYLQHILRDKQRNYGRVDMIYKAVTPLLGNGLLTASGDVWMRQRRLIQPHMHRHNIANLGDIISGAIDEQLQTWPALLQENSVLDVYLAMSHLSMQVASRGLFGLRGLSQDRMNELNNYILDIMDQINSRILLFFLPDWLPRPGDRMFRHLITTIRARIGEIIEQVRRDNDRPSTLLGILMDAVDGETSEGMTDTQLIDEALTIFSAGYETTATALTWATYLIGQHPEVAQRIREEVAHVMGKRLPTMEDFTKLSYTRMVFMETLRLYPPASMLPRTALENDVIDGYSVNAGDVMLLFFYGAQRHPDYWENPAQFDPERFSPERSKNRDPFAFLSFGAGPHRCVGQEFAMVEAVMTLAMMMQRFRIELVPDHPVVPKLVTTLRPRHGVRAFLKPI